ncbi:MAG: M23 family metallopeptidase [Hyphomicrobiaceae bacterium]|nr:M23 family metallopeptidase [Hyphomicrobiaceae bacterium]
MSSLRWIGAGAIALVLVGLSLDIGKAEAPRFSMPLSCAPEDSCFIQNYVDLDPSKEVRDYQCNKASYEGHKGTDFRLTSVRALKRGVDVLAAAPGTIKAVRNDVRDRLLNGPLPAALKGRECGNGLVIDHGEGWESQYCHMRRGSLLVKKGDQVTRGQKLGLVGLSGKTQFPHLHHAIRHEGKVIDPFSGNSPTADSCTLKSGAALYEAKIIKQFPYRSGQLFLRGFAIEGAILPLLMDRGAMVVPASTKAPALVYYAQVLNLQKGDQLHIRLMSPKGLLAQSKTPPMDHSKAHYMAYAGKRRISFAWPKGTYTGTISLLRNGKTLWQKSEELVLK